MATQSCRGDRRSLSETITITIIDAVAAVQPNSILLKRCARPSWQRHEQEWLPKSRIIGCDTEIDSIEVGDEIAVEIPLWLARNMGLAE